MCTYEAMGIDRILLGTDFPYEDTEECMQFVKQLPIAQEEKEKVYYRNAAQLGIA
jgi:predicted TIM-barrel fold metal-dependent hydrolase